MRASEIRDMTDADIRGRIAELEEERFRLKFRGATETLEDPLRLRTVRKDIARLHTVLRERTLGLVRGGAPAGPATAPKRKTATKRAAKTAAKR
jgi:large subunit ribosomal protein L29